MGGYLALLMFIAVCCVLLAGYPVAFTLGGVALITAALGILVGAFDANLLFALPDRIYGTMNSYTLIAVPLFILMGNILERSRLAEKLLRDMALICIRLPAGLGISVVLVGVLLAACTGIVGATVITMGLISLPTLLQNGYKPSLAAGTICATGTLGQIIPPSIALVLLGDVLSIAYQQAQLRLGIFNPQPVSVGDLFIGAIIPGLLLVFLYVIYLLYAAGNPTTESCQTSEISERPSIRELLTDLAPPILLIVLVLGSIIAGAATPTEAAGIGALGAFLMAVSKGSMSLEALAEVCRSTLRITAMVFAILLGASLFSLVFRGLGGEHYIFQLFEQLPGGRLTALFVVMLLIFLLGFILDFIEITFVVIPIVGPVLLQMGIDPIWLGIMIALNLQTSFLTPPFGFALFYLRGVAPDSVSSGDIFRGVVPFIMIQLTLMLALAVWPGLVTWLPQFLH